MCIAHGAHGQPQISILSFLSQIFHLWKSQHTFYKDPMTWKKQKYLMARKKNKMFQAPMIKLSAPPKKYWQNKSINTIEKSTSDLLLSQTCIIKAMTCSLASISSPA